jgi:hypothetical protein
LERSIASKPPINAGVVQLYFARELLHFNFIIGGDADKLQTFAAVLVLESHEFRAFPRDKAHTKSPRN